ncbi:hypothetical protein [Streptomyces thermodiastaticus]|uniref:hypothetical protein n=1 Tax=Streptomyces thermodiastaticus TaxID=44061 RepID=UPI001671FF6A|nr:hypothetical protein [Streptomyces thermodiastaticus]MCE7549376.1 hypothetical protein [Streptomyces thermodiastaticus]GHF80397.1 hypothetical protein GCM10018787_31410 [Streptomyces thermodiastaticus]
MAGFRSLARQVRDPRCDLALRRYSLRKCLERFAPYGHRATWDHLCTHWGFGPEDRSADPARLVAALEELEEARAVWLDYEQQFARRRRQEKHDGLRRPGSRDDWHRMTWGGFGVLWCDDPRVHPSGPLAEVLRRLIAALERPPGATCPVCGCERLEWRHGLQHEPSFGPVCAHCGILVPRHILTPQALAESQRAPLLVSA